VGGAGIVLSIGFATVLLLRYLMGHHGAGLDHHALLLVLLSGFNFFAFAISASTCCASCSGRCHASSTWSGRGFHRQRKETIAMLSDDLIYLRKLEAGDLDRTWPGSTILAFT